TIGWAWLRAVHDDEREALEARWREAVQREADFTAEARLGRPGGQFRAHTIHAVPERDGDGTLVGWLGTMTDVEDLRQAISARDQFLATASHELRTPLATLGLVVEALRSLVAGPDLPVDIRGRMLDKLAIAERQNQRLDRLVGALLDVTRIAGGRPLLDLERCDAVLVVREAVERLNDQAVRGGTSISLETVDTAPGWYDPLRLDQVV